MDEEVKDRKPNRQDRDRHVNKINDAMVSTRGKSWRTCISV